MTCQSATQSLRHGDGRFVSPAPRGHRQSPLLQRVSYFKQLLARLDEQGTKRSSAMALEGSASFKIAALRYTRVKAKIGDQLFAVTKPAHITHRCYHSIKGNQIDPTESGQAQQCFLGHDLLGHVPAQQRAPGSRCQQTTVQLLQQHFARRRPLSQGKQARDRVGVA